MLSKKAVLAAVVVAMALAGSAVGLRRPLLRWAAAHWTQKLQAAPDEQIEPLLRQAAAWGEDGLPVLVEALGSNREAVAWAARRVIFAELDRCKQLPIHERTARLAVLAQALAGRVEQFGPPARGCAAEIAARILLWPLDSETTSSQELIAACETILRAKQAPPPAVAGSGALSEPNAASGTLASARGNDQDKPGAAAVLARRVPLRGPGQETADDQPEAAEHQTVLAEEQPVAAEDQPVAEMARLPGGGLPIEWFPTPPGDPRGDVTADRHPGDEPELLPGPREARRLSPSGPSSAAEEGNREPDSHAPAVQQRTPPDGAQRSILNGEMRLGAEKAGFVAAGPEAGPGGGYCAGEKGDSLAGLDLLELMSRLSAADHATASAAQAELVRRGFGPRELGLARRLTDPRPQVRRELAKMLPGLAGVDAVAWLRWLSRDQDAEVRLAAVTVMATTSDPALLRQLESMARQDPDPRVRQAAERLASRRTTNVR